LIEIFRNGRVFTAEIIIGERPSALAGIFRASGGNDQGRLGLTVESVSPEIRSAMHLNTHNGALVLEVNPGSPADNAGVLPGDVICAMNKTPIKEAANLISVLHKIREDGTVLLKLERHGSTIYVAFQATS
jgi:S1-C subfamily serine protease